jgi:hypothetical protein
MLSLKKYTYIAVVGAVVDYGLNKYLTNTKTTGEISTALKGFYSKVDPLKAAVMAGATFVAVVLIADLIQTSIEKNKQ